MPQLAAHLGQMFNEVPPAERFAAAAKAGFKGVEATFYDIPAEQVAALLKQHGLTHVLLNLSTQEWGKNDRGFAALPGREAQFEALLAKAIAYARVTGAKRLHVQSGNRVPERTEAEQTETLIANLRKGAEMAAPYGIILGLEPLNANTAPDYFLKTTDHAIAILDRVNHPNASLQFDTLHVQIMEGNVTERMRKLAGRYAHVQIAGVPGRDEPDHGELNNLHLLRVLDEIGYPGWVGLEYRPAKGTLAGLGWAQPWGITGNA